VRTAALWHRACASGSGLAHVGVVVGAEVVVSGGAREDVRGVYAALDEGDRRAFGNPQGARLTPGEKGVWGLVFGGEVVARGRSASEFPWDEARRMEGADWEQKGGLVAPLKFEGASTRPTGVDSVSVYSRRMFARCGDMQPGPLQCDGWAGRGGVSRGEGVTVGGVRVRGDGCALKRRAHDAVRRRLVIPLTQKEGHGREVKLSSAEAVALGLAVPQKIPKRRGGVRHVPAWQVPVSMAPVELGFAVTSYKLQGRTLSQLMVSLAKGDNPRAN
jgi:hypothetical protein